MVWVTKETRECVRRGIKLLDEKGPPNWRELVKGTKPLDWREMSSLVHTVGECGCVTGRIFMDGYDEATELFTGSSDYMKSMHFMVNHGFNSVVTNWDELAKAWREELGWEAPGTVDRAVEREPEEDEGGY